MKALVLSTDTGGTAVAHRLGAEGHATRICYSGGHDGVGAGLTGVEVVEGWREQLPWADLVVAVGDGGRQWRRAVRQHGRLIFGLPDMAGAVTLLEPADGEVLAHALMLWNGRRWMDTALLVVSEHRHLSGGFGAHIADGMGWLGWPLDAQRIEVVRNAAAGVEASMRESDYRGPVLFSFVVAPDGGVVSAGSKFSLSSPVLALLAEASTVPLADVLSGVAGGTLDAWPLRAGAAVAAQRLSVAPWPFETTRYGRVEVEIAEGALRHVWLHGVGREADAALTTWYTDCRGDIGFALAHSGGEGSPKRRVREALRRVERVADGISSWALQLRSDISGVLGARFALLNERGLT